MIDSHPPLAHSSPGKKSTLLDDTDACHNKNEQRSGSALQEWQLIGESACDEQSADQACENDHCPILETTDQDYACNSAYDCLQPFKQTGIHAKKI